VSAAAAPAAPAPGAFSTRIVLALVVVGLVAFSGFAVLSAYAPELQAGGPGAHAASRSAVGYAGLRALLEGQGVEVVISRSEQPYSLRPRPGRAPLLVVTPPRGAGAKDLEPFLNFQPLLIVLPKWQAAPHPSRPEWVRKAGLVWASGAEVPLLSKIAPGTRIDNRRGASRPTLVGAETQDEAAIRLPLGEIDRLQTISGPSLRPVVVDDQGRTVVACSNFYGQVCILADPDLINTHGIKSRDTARAGLDVINSLRSIDGPVMFDVTLHGIQADRNLLKLMLTPPFLGFTLCAVAAALAMGWHAAARFGPTAREDRALALGKQALVDNSAGLFRMAGKEHELAPAYLRLVEQQAARAAGGERAPHGEAERQAWLDRIAAGRGVESSLSSLEDEARRARSRGDLLGLARRLYHWRSEMMRERR
jgi:hypothetical protein